MDPGRLLRLAQQLASTFGSDYQLSMLASLTIKTLSPPEMKQFRRYFWLLRKADDVAEALQRLDFTPFNKLLLFAGVGFSDDVKSMFPLPAPPSVNEQRLQIVKAAATGAQMEVLSFLAPLHRTEGCTVLKLAVRYQHLPMLQLALASDPVLEKGLFKKETTQSIEFLLDHLPILTTQALSWSIEWQRPQLLQLVLSRDVELSYQQLRKIIYTGNIDMVSIALDFYSGELADDFLTSMMFDKKSELVRLVLARPGLNLSQKALDRGFSSVTYLKDHRLEIARTLVNAGARPTYQTLRSVAIDQRTDLEWYLVKEGISRLNLNHALRAVAAGENVALAEYLLDQGATAVTEAILANIKSGPMNDFLLSRPEADLSAVLAKVSSSKYDFPYFYHVLQRRPPDLNWALRIAARDGEANKFLALVAQGATNVDEALEVARRGGQLEILQVVERASARRR